MFHFKASGYLPAAAAERPDAGLGNSIDILRYSSAAFLPTNLTSASEPNEHGEFWSAEVGFLGDLTVRQFVGEIPQNEGANGSGRSILRLYISSSNSIRIQTATVMAIASFEVMVLNCLQ
ncbi:hypothetical protein K456DRAFT_1593111 [Colletotrichum gloeosporioides 23]|nr:hypothetical protein K456DRAFT_1593111 [Colletotrichum gloeosporioides 23]